MPEVFAQTGGRFQHCYPSLVAMVTAHAGGKDNVMPAAWNLPLSYDPPLYGVSISPDRFTHALISEAREFAVGFLPLDHAQLIAATGGVSGREVDKFQQLAIGRRRATKVAAPLLTDAYVSYECTVVGQHPCGDHDLFVGEIVAVHIAAGALTDQGALDVQRVRPALYMGADLYLTADSHTLISLDRRALDKGHISR